LVVPDIFEGAQMIQQMQHKVQKDFVASTCFENIKSSGKS